MMDIKVLQPEVLSVEDLTVLLRQRNINVDRVADKEALVQLVYRYMVPRPQRKYRTNRRGLAMTAKQQKRAAAVGHLNARDTSANKTYAVVNSLQSRSSETGSFGAGPSSSTGVVHDRLKPPVSAINMEHKVIKLSGSRNTFASSSMQTQNSHRLKQLPNKLTSTQGDSSTLPSNSSQKIRLGRPGIVSAVEKPQQLQNVADTSSTSPAKRVSVTAGETEKKKFKSTAITWP